MRFTILEKPTLTATINPNEFIDTLKNILNGYLQEVYQEEEVDVRPGTEEKSETIIEVPILGEMYSDREEAAKNLLPSMQRISKKINDEFKNQIPKFSFSVTTELGKHAGQGKAAQRLTKILFSYSFAVPEIRKNLYAGKLKSLSFKPLLENSASIKTVAFEIIPFLIATDKIRVNEITRECTYNKRARNRFHQLDEKQIELMFNKFNEKPDRGLIEQGLVIKNKLLPKVADANFTIVTSYSPLLNEIKKIGVSLIKEKFKMAFSPDKFSTFDVLFVKNLSFHKIFGIKKDQKIENFLNSFTALLASFNTSPKFNYLGISMKKSTQSQGGKATTFFNQHLDAKGGIKADMDVFEMNKVDDVDARTRKRKILFNVLRKDIKNKANSTKGIKIKLTEDEGFKKFWFTSDDKQDLINAAKLKNKQKNTPVTIKSLLTAKNLDIDSIQKLKYKSMLFVRALFTTNIDNNPTTNFINMLHVALATRDTYNPSYFKIEGKKILAYNVKRMNMVLNETASNPIQIWFAKEKQSELIRISIPVKLTVFDISGNDIERTTDAIVQFRCSKEGINPEVQRFHISEKQREILGQLITEKTQEIIDKINSIG